MVINMRFLTKFFIGILIVIIVPIVIISYVINQSIEDYIYQEIIVRLHDDVDECEADLNQIAQSMINLGFVFSRDSNFIDILNEEVIDKLEVNYYFDYIIDNVENYSLNDNWYMNVTFVDRNKTVYTNWSDNTHVMYDESLEPYVETAIQNKGTFSWLVYEKDFTRIKYDKHHISMVFALYDYSDRNHYLGTMVISVNEDKILDIITKYNLHENIYGMMKEDGEFIYTDTMYELEKNYKIEEDIKAKIGEVDSAGRKIVTIDNLYYVLTETKYPTQWTVGESKLTLVNLFLEDEITYAFQEYARKISILYGMGILLIVVFSFLVIRKLLSPLSLLTSKISNYKGGEIVEGLDINRKDEIGILNHSFVEMSKNITQLIVNIKRESDFKERYHYEAMMAQLTPHFLFNTLNTIRWMALIRKADNIVKCTDSLSGMLKYSMNKEGEIVTLREEITQIMNYIDIHTYRFGNEIQLNHKIEEAVMELKVIKFLIQPLVENSIIHGFKEKDENLEITISAYVQSSEIFITITDNGQGISNEMITELLNRNKNEIKPPNSSTGIGVNHINTRIKYLYGEKYGIDIKSQRNDFTSVTISMPLIDDRGNVQ